MRADLDRIRDILGAISEIEKYAGLGREALESNELVRVWMVHYLQLIGEAAGKLSGEFRQRHSELPWEEIIAMRNILVHHYFEVDMDEIWSSIEKDLPVLRRRVEEILRGA